MPRPMPSPATSHPIAAMNGGIALASTVEVMAMPVATRMSPSVTS